MRGMLAKLVEEEARVFIYSEGGVPWSLEQQQGWKLEVAPQS